MISYIDEILKYKDESQFGFLVNWSGDCGWIVINLKLKKIAQRIGSIEDHILKLSSEI